MIHDLSFHNKHSFLPEHKPSVMYNILGIYNFANVLPNVLETTNTFGSNWVINYSFFSHEASPSYVAFLTFLVREISKPKWRSRPGRLNNFSTEKCTHLGLFLKLLQVDFIIFFLWYSFTFYRELILKCFQFQRLRKCCDWQLMTT